MLSVGLLTLTRWKEKIGKEKRHEWAVRTLQNAFSWKGKAESNFSLDKRETKVGVEWHSWQGWGMMNPCPAEGQNTLWVMCSVSGRWEVKCQEEVLPPPVWYLMGQRRGRRQHLSYASWRAWKLPIHSSDWKTPQGCWHSCHKQPVTVDDISKVKVGCKGSAGIQLSLRICPTPRAACTRRTAFPSCFHHSSGDAKWMTKIGK